ncbi:probable transporter, permease component [Candidatus Phytoplasma mali]|uniref:Probable transporter, permease component n=1 Tax=Phytoplasma mali (strain AT) TaxID=482235 RepID=B3QZY0_PHYMT|nr:transporter permease [Candidatus Phytoplasma mali]CAP18517.1 probable transporter, permease component [Candidatus Phytoplasma mali]
MDVVFLIKLMSKLKETLELSFISCFMGALLGFLLGISLYKTRKNDKIIKKIFYSTINKIINIFTHLPFIFFSLFTVLIFELFSKNNEKGGFICACFILTSYLTLVFAKKIEKMFIKNTKNYIFCLKKIIKNKNFISELTIQITSLFITGICYSTIAGGSFGGNNEGGLGLGVIAYEQYKNDQGFNVLICFIVIVLTIQIIYLIGNYLSQKIKINKNI